MGKDRLKIEVSGVVHGVGFGPFVYRLARERRLCGFVHSNSAGVEIELEGVGDQIDEFMLALEQDAPASAHIREVRTHKMKPNGYEEFTIRDDDYTQCYDLLVPPDMGICPECLRELMDPDDRRYHYPLISCSNCGPRYSLTMGSTYIRPNTSMVEFDMCPDCEAEYHDPTSRRHHDPTNSCPNCGVDFYFTEGTGLRVHGDPVHLAVSIIKGGWIVAVKGVGGFQLMCDATNEAAVRRLRHLNRNDEHPYAVMSRGMDDVLRYAIVSDDESRLLTSSRSPITLLRKRVKNHIAGSVTMGSAFVGAVLAHTPIQHLLLSEDFEALAVTTGQRGGAPIIADNEEALKTLGRVADYFLMHDREIYHRTSDSIERVNRGQPVVIRRSRGYVPMPVYLNVLESAHGKILAMGSDRNNAICVLQDSRAFLSQPLGNLEDQDVVLAHEDARAHLLRILRMNPDVIAYDIHPHSVLSHWAHRQRDRRVIGVPHHHAHMAACMAENDLAEPVIGIILDGLGYGDDGHTWGGEVLLGDQLGYIRAAHLEYFPMPGGPAAIREPWRMAISYLHGLYGDEVNKLRLDFVRNLKLPNARLMLHMLEEEVNSPLTSSCGRLLDGVASLMGLRQEVTYEGQAAFDLEMALLRGPGRRYKPSASYPMELIFTGGLIKLSPRPMFRALVDDIKRGEDHSIMSWKVHNGLIRHFVRIVDYLAHRHLIQKVVLSGGCFENYYLSTQLRAKLEKKGYEVFSHTQVPTGNGGLALGQAYVAAARMGETGN